MSHNDEYPYMVPSEPISSKDKKVFWAFQVGGLVINGISQVLMAYGFVPNIVFIVGMSAIGIVHFIAMIIARKDLKYVIWGAIFLVVDIIFFVLLGGGFVNK